eukprot:NODE_137_length_18042_cov_0.768823.p12 type:complete len:119 gc:universal NODE_137_length_18042_cov_0.768823:17649-17293(-)
MIDKLQKSAFALFMILVAFLLFSISEMIQVFPLLITTTIGAGLLTVRTQRNVKITISLFIIGMISTLVLLCLDLDYRPLEKSIFILIVLFVSVIYVSMLVYYYKQLNIVKRHKVMYVI